jgi:hypothetical protein
MEASITFAIVSFIGGAAPIICAASSDIKLLDTLRHLNRGSNSRHGGVACLPDFAAACAWLASLPRPSGCYESHDEVAEVLKEYWAAHDERKGRSTWRLGSRGLLPFQCGDPQRPYCRRDSAKTLLNVGRHILIVTL